MIFLSVFWCSCPISLFTISEWVRNHSRSHWSRGFESLRKRDFAYSVHQNAGRKNRYRLFLGLYLSAYCGDFIEQIKKSVICNFLRNDRKLVRVDLKNSSTRRAEYIQINNWRTFSLFLFLSSFSINLLASSQCECRSLFGYVNYCRSWSSQIMRAGRSHRE